jgi:hypothetical protein
MLSMDATTYFIETDKDNKLVWHIPHRDDRKQVQRKGEGGLGLFIKEMCLVNGIGDSSDSVYIIQDPDMDADECVHYVVPGLSSSLIAGALGHIFVMKSRAANVKFNQMYIEFVFVPFTVDIRRNLQISKDIDAPVDSDRDDEDDSLCGDRILFTFDGEPVQLAGFFDEDFIEYCSSNRIIALKLAASCTAIQQPLDAGNKFDSKKKNNRASRTTYENPVLTNTLRQVLKKHTGIQPRQAILLIQGFHELNQADYNTLDRQKIVLGFEAVGMVPFNKQKILDNCTTHFTPDDISNIMKRLPYLRDSFETNGRLLDEIMDDCDIPVSEIQKLSNKDAKAIMHERVVWVNHKLTIIRTLVAAEASEAKEAKKKVVAANNVVTDHHHFNMVKDMFLKDMDWTTLSATSMKGALRHIKSEGNLSIKTTGKKSELVSVLRVRLNIMKIKLGHEAARLVRTSSAD